MLRLLGERGLLVFILLILASPLLCGKRSWRKNSGLTGLTEAGFVVASGSIGIERITAGKACRGEQEAADHTETTENRKRGRLSKHQSKTSKRTLRDYFL